MFFNKKKKVEEFRKQWGKPIDRFRNFDLIAVYHQLSSLKFKGEYVDDKTWDDLNFNTFFSMIDRNTSVVGQQYLYHLLHKYEKDEYILKRRFELAKLMKNDISTREQIQLHLQKLNEAGSYFIPNIILRDSLPSSKYYVLFYILAFMPLVFVALSFFSGVFFFAILFLFAVNVLVSKVQSKIIYGYFGGFEGLNILINVALALAKLEPERQIKELESLVLNKDLLKKLRRKIGYLVLNKESMNEMIAVAIEYMNMILLFDVIAYYRSVNILHKSQSYMKEVFENVAELDTAIAVASYLQELPIYSTPIFVKEKKISFENLYHPLIVNAVPNTVVDLNKSVLITGSNMSGKTTFIKTVGINAILSQTLYFCCAKKFELPTYIVKSSVNREEDLSNNKSYFFVEVESLKNFTGLTSSGSNYIFLIDEIFRGTNTVERLAASTAVLKYLDNNNIIFVTTHDIELQELLQNEFGMLHFSEQVENGRYYFDYKIHDGPCKTRNAIKLLEIKNYPESIISEANSIAKNLTKSSKEIL